jgi:hypothetical protein
LAEAGLEPQRHYFVVLDELHRALQAGGGVIEHLDLLTRLNRSWLVGQVMITHTMKDLDAVADKQDRARARGFVERSGMVFLGGLPPSEMQLLQKVVRLSKREEDLVTSWSSPPGFDTSNNEDVPPPGRGNFLIKVGHRPGIPFNMRITHAERGFNRTNSKWAQISRIGATTPAALSPATRKEVAG